MPVGYLLRFWNTYNIYLPLDTLALNGALLEWGHYVEALDYLHYFFTTKVCTRPLCLEPPPGQGNISYGEIDYDIFGCDSVPTLLNVSLDIAIRLIVTR